MSDPTFTCRDCGTEQPVANQWTEHETICSFCIGLGGQMGHDTTDIVTRCGACDGRGGSTEFSCMDCSRPTREVYEETEDGWKTVEVWA